MAIVKEHIEPKQRGLTSDYALNLSQINSPSLYFHLYYL